MKASDGGTLPTKPRQIMYAARPEILASTGKDTLDDAYFTQTLSLISSKSIPRSALRGTLSGTRAAISASRTPVRTCLSEHWRSGNISMARQ